MQEKLVVSLTEGQEVDVESQSHQRRKGVVEAVNVSKGAYSDSKEKRLRIKLRIKKIIKKWGKCTQRRRESIQRGRADRKGEEGNNGCPRSQRKDIFRRPEEG